MNTQHALDPAYIELKRAELLALRAQLQKAATVEEDGRAVVKSDVEQPGDEDVFRKVFEDLKGSGVAASEGEVRMKMAELLAVAREQLKAGE